MYKYTEKKFAHLLYKYGYLRLGTIFDFRKNEHNKGIFDQDEGKKYVTHQPGIITVSASNYEDFKASDQSKALEDLANININKGATVGFFGTKFYREFQSPNAFIFCTSSELSKSAMHSIENADTCIEIIDPYNFYTAITNELSKFYSINYIGYRPIEYKSRNINWAPNHHENHPAFLKEKDFEVQKEIRAIWAPTQDIIITPTFLLCPKASKYIKIIEF